MEARSERLLRDMSEKGILVQKIDVVNGLRKPAALQHAEHGLNNTTRKKGKTFQHDRKNRKRKPPYRRRQTECKVSFKVQRVKGVFLRNVGNQKEMAVFAAV